MPNYLAFLSFIFLTAFTPGPNNIMAMTTAGKFGFSGSLRFCLGVLGGFLLVMSACAIFCLTFAALLPSIEPVMRYIGALYILFLAVVILLDRPSGKEKKSLFRPESMLNGFVMQCVNVKVILYGVTAFSAFILPSCNDPLWLGAFVILLALVGFVGTGCWALCGSMLQRLFITRRRLMNCLLSAALVYCAVTIVL